MRPIIAVAVLFLALTGLSGVTYSQEVVKATRGPFIDPNGRVNIPDIDDQQKFLMWQGSLKYKDPVSVRDMVDYSYADYAVKVLGEFKGK